MSEESQWICPTCGKVYNNFDSEVLVCEGVCPNCGEDMIWDNGA